MPELPSGTVTFVFTDVEGSTRLLKQLRERYADGLTIHQRLLREAFRVHGGHELDTQGDAFFYAFPRAREAVLAAVEAQRALGAYTGWPDGAAFKVRMGIHTGQAQVSNGRYTGLAVHRAARICAAAHGGQVLVSQATETLLADEEEDLQATLRSLGHHRLKDLDRPVSLYQVGAAGLQTKFPQLREQAPAAASWVRRPVVLIPAILAVAGIGQHSLCCSAQEGTVGFQGRAQQRRRHRRQDEQDRRSGAGRDQARPGLGCGRNRMGREPRRQVADSGGCLDSDARRHRPARQQDADRVGRHSDRGLGGRRPPWLRSAHRPPVQPICRGVSVAQPSDSGSVAVGGGGVGRLRRFDPGPSRLGLRPGHRLRVRGLEPVGIVYAEGAVWVSNSGDSTVSRFNPQYAPAARSGCPRRSVASRARSRTGRGALGDERR